MRWRRQRGNNDDKEVGACAGGGAAAVVKDDDEVDYLVPVLINAATSQFWYWVIPVPVLTSIIAHKEFKKWDSRYGFKK